MVKVTKEEKYSITVEEAAQRLNVSKSTIYNRLKEDEFDAKKIESKYGPRWFINQEEFKQETEIVEKIEEVIEAERGINPNQLLLQIKEVLEEDIRSDIKQAIIEILETNSDLVEKSKLEVIEEGNQNSQRLLQSLSEIKKYFKKRDNLLVEELGDFLTEQNRELKEENRQLQEITKELFQQNQELIKQNQNQKKEFENFKEEIKATVKEEIKATREETVDIVKKASVRINDYSKKRDTKIVKELKRNQKLKQKQQVEKEKAKVRKKEESLLDKIKNIFR